MSTGRGFKAGERVISNAGCSKLKFYRRQNFMREEIKKLCALQALDLEKKAWEDEKARMTRELEELREKITEEEKLLQEEKQLLQQEQVQIKEKELEVEEKKGHIDKYQEQLFKIKNNKEYQALVHEIEKEKADIRVLEEKMLEFMEEAEAEKEKKDAVQAELDNDWEDFRRKEEEAGREFKRIDREVKGLNGRRESMVEDLDEELYSKYERIFSRKPGRVLVEVENGACLGCNVEVTSQVLNDLEKANEVNYCVSCGRLIYLPPGE